jgi:hypothetical protein
VTTEHLIGLATRIQRRRDFGAHLTGFAAGTLVLTIAAVATGTSPFVVALTLFAWATALSFQHFRHVLRGPVTSADVAAENARLSTVDHASHR